MKYELDDKGQVKTAMSLQETKKFYAAENKTDRRLV